MARQFRLIRWAFGFVALAASFALHAQVAISPQILDIPLDDSAQTYAFRLYNYMTEDKRVRVSLARNLTIACGTVR